MTPKIRYNFWIDAPDREALRLVKARDGIPESEQIRRAIAEWLERKGVKKAERRPAGTRRRS